MDPDALSPAADPVSRLPRPAMWAMAGVSAAAVIGLGLATVLVDLETASWVASLVGAVLSAAALAWSVGSLNARTQRQCIRVRGGRAAAGGNVVAPGATLPAPSDAAADADVYVCAGPDGIAAGQHIVGVNLDRHQ
ncbi:hypothetical protein ABZS79_30360 [Streptomyces griseoloalbus]|uniref:hypothetical protein n=1 Tax=Streptomyces griseoloalbus TaxID=67303 RepID=UPI0033A40790